MSQFHSGRGRNVRGCPLHGKELNYLCVAHDCMTDLCQTCVIIHQELHNQQGTSAAIENYDETLALCLSKINRLIGGYRHEIGRLETARSVKAAELETFQKEVQAKIDNARNWVVDLVNRYFDDLMETTKQNYLGHIKMLWTNRIDTPIAQMKQKIEKLEGQKRNLASEARQKDIIKYAFGKDEQQMLAVLRSRADEWISRSQQIVHDPDKVELTREEDKVEGFFGSLADMVGLQVDIKDLSTALGKNRGPAGDISGDINQDISLLGNRDTFGGLNDSLGRNTEAWKIPNPQSKEPLRTAGLPHVSSRRQLSTAAFPPPPAMPPAPSKESLRFPGELRSSKAKPKFSMEPEDDLEAETMFAVPTNSDYKEHAWPTPQPTPQLHQTPSYKAGAFPPATSSQRRFRAGPSLAIDAPDFFSPEAHLQILHFFETKTKNFYYVLFSKENMDLIEQGRKLSFSSVPLDLGFTIPRHTRSVITPQGYVVLLGGLAETQPGRSSRSDPHDVAFEFFPNVYLLDTHESTLMEMPPMEEARAAHAVLAVGNRIFVVGGIGSNGLVTDSCEVFDFETNQWTALGPLREPCMNASLCLVRNKFIAKIGGKTAEKDLSNTIELMDLQREEWEVLALPQAAPILPSMSCAIEVREGHVLFFGGVYEEKTVKSNKVFGITFAEDGEVERIEEAAAELPNADGFSESQAIIHDNTLFVLQSKSREEKPDTQLADQRRILMLRDSKWSVLN